MRRFMVLLSIKCESLTVLLEIEADVPPAFSGALICLGLPTRVVRCGSILIMLSCVPTEDSLKPIEQISRESLQLLQSRILCECRQ
jgi:hypothetical protein